MVSSSVYMFLASLYKCALAVAGRVATPTRREWVVTMNCLHDCGHDPVDQWARLASQSTQDLPRWAEAPVQRKTVTYGPALRDLQHHNRQERTVISIQGNSVEQKVSIIVWWPWIQPTINNRHCVQGYQHLNRYKHSRLLMNHSVEMELLPIDGFI